MAKDLADAFSELMGIIPAEEKEDKYDMVNPPPPYEKEIIPPKTDYITIAGNQFIKQQLANLEQKRDDIIKIKWTWVIGD